MDTTPPSPAQLGQQLLNFQHAPSLPNELTLLLRPARFAVRDVPGQKLAYGQEPLFWNGLSQVWAAHAALLAGGESSCLTSLATLGAFSASLCAQCELNQERTLREIEPSLRVVLLTASSFSNLQDENFLPMTRACCQALANLVTANDSVADSHLRTRLALEAEDNLLSRLLASPDSGVLSAVLVLLLNAIKGNSARATLLSSSKAGAAILDRVLVLLALQTEEDNEQGPASDSPVFGLGYSIVEEVLSLGAFPAAYEAQVPMDGFAICDAQLTLLKLLDGYLQQPALEGLPPIEGLVPFLVQTLRKLSANLRDEGRQRDTRDASTFQAAVLLLLGLSSVALASAEGREACIPAIDDAVLLLKYSDSLSKPQAQAKIEEVSERKEEVADTPAIAQLKRTCVKLLGTLAYDQPLAQDLVRESGGLVALLGHCQMSDVNPTLREHALFAIRNVLKGNQRNQDLIEEMKPLYGVDPRNGEMRDLPPALRAGGERAGL